eukprot:CAMPEP_0184967406 /NCGR_PEP_ID=MMETSP1098-20130426/792_1 /TAXON_ID=89044 /ORGANISM="Spumella elongata, Strain CCAP 955/1" /LENGTH=453 /DNA_ID=CAMNT_0027488857 /DNA_START=52 /DNA_END=1413 /DNA_ORIENTATION=+
MTVLCSLAIAGAFILGPGFRIFKQRNNNQFILSPSEATTSRFNRKTREDFSSRRLFGPEHRDISTIQPTAARHQEAGRDAKEGVLLSADTQPHLLRDPLVFELAKLRKTQKVSKQKPHRITAESYPHLEARVRNISTAYAYAQLAIEVNGISVVDNASLKVATQGVDGVHQLNVKSQSQEFHKFNTLESVTSYARIDFITECPALTSLFPSVVHLQSFHTHCTEIKKYLLEFVCDYTKVANSEMFSRHIINGFWSKASLLANEAAMHSSLPSNRTAITEGHEEMRIHTEYETDVVGKLAHGKLDYAFYTRTIILALLQVEKLSSPTEDAIFQAIAQMVAVRERAVRYYAKYYNKITEVEIEDIMKKYATFGIASNGKNWIFLRYSWSEHKKAWRLEQSRTHDLVIDPVEAKGSEYMTLQIENLLSSLAGAALLQQRHVVDLEATLTMMQEQRE